MKTLFIGLGGLGGRVLMQTKKRMEAEGAPMENYRFFVLDRDVYDLEKLLEESDIPGFCMHIDETYGQYIASRVDRAAIKKWYPAHPSFLQASDVSGMRRIFGRLAFLEAMEAGGARKLEYLLYPLLTPQDIQNQVRVVIVTSLAGGTGAGCFIQVAQWIERQLLQYWNVQPQICGFFVGAELYTQVLAPTGNQAQQAMMRANAHAALRELHWLTRVKRHAIVPPERIILDGVLDSDREYPRMVIFNQAYLYDADENAKLSMDEHMKRIAQSLYLRYGSSTTQQIDSMQAGSLRWSLGLQVYVPIDEDLEKTRQRLQQPDGGIVLEECPIAQAEKYRMAYRQECIRACRESLPGPHMDNRWPQWLVEHW